MDLISYLFISFKNEYKHYKPQKFVISIKIMGALSCSRDNLTKDSHSKFYI